MRNLLWTLVLFIPLGLFGQKGPGFEIGLEETAIKGMPGLQSFSYGVHEGKWLLIGGRTDGLHKRQPFASFDPNGRPAEIHVVDPKQNKVWSQSIKKYPAELREQLQSTNLVFHQKGGTLILVGGYGYSETAQNFRTHDMLTLVDIAGVIRAIRAHESAAGFFHSYRHPTFQVTGGQVAEIGEWLYLVGGQDFSGRYNPMGPDFGQGFRQVYTNEIRGFRFSGQGSEVKLEFGQVFRDTALLHRRDYNVVPQILEDGRHAAVLFSGVFQYAQDIPWLNAVIFDGKQYREIPGFEQLLNQYQCARLPVYDRGQNQMHTYFFGGMGRYVPTDGGLIDDVNVPFVKTISRVTRDAGGSWTEYDTGMRMPGFLGAAAEFIAEPLAAWQDGILHLDKLPSGKTLVGTIVGGLESRQPNTFFEAEDDLSWASKRAVRVYVTRL